jgi:hypothetical protein
MIRPAVIAVFAFLVIGVAVLLLWPTLSAMFQDAVPPGQFPLSDPRPKWPASERVRPYSPGPMMGSDEAVSSNVSGPKVDCALGIAPCN